MPKFKDRFAQLRKEMGLTQEQIAFKLGVSKGTVGNYETGEREPRDLETLEDIADFFNVEIDYLVGRTNERPEFSLEEQWIMRCYRNADPDTKIAIKTLLRKFDQDTVSAVG